MYSTQFFWGCYSRDNYVDSQSNFLETTWKEMAGTYFYTCMFWFCFISEMFSALSVTFCMARRSFVFLLVWLFIILLFIWFWEVNLSKLQLQQQRVQWLCKRVIILCSFLCRCLQRFTKQWEIATFCIFQRTWTMQRSIVNILSRILKVSYMSCLGYFWQYRQTERIQILLRFVDWILNKSFFNQRCLWCCYHCCCFLLFGQLSGCTFDHLFVQLPSLCLCVCLLCTRLSRHFTAVHSVVLFVLLRYICLKLPLKFWNVLENCTESQSSFACNQNIKEDISTALNVWGFSLLCSETNKM